MGGTSDNYDGQVSMPFLIKMCFTKKHQFYIKRADNLPDHHNYMG